MIILLSKISIIIVTKQIFDEGLSCYTVIFRANIAHISPIVYCVVVKIRCSPLKFLNDNVWRYILSRYFSDTKSNLKGNDDNIIKGVILRTGRIEWVHEIWIQFEWKQERFRDLVVHRTA